MLYLIIDPKYFTRKVFDSRLIIFGCFLHAFQTNAEVRVVETCRGLCTNMFCGVMFHMSNYITGHCSLLLICCVYMWVPEETRGVRSPGARVIGSCE